MLLSGPGGFPLHLIGRCPPCSVTLGAWQSGPVAARPLSVAYPQNAELRSYRVYDVDEPSVVVAEGEAVWELFVILISCASSWCGIEKIICAR